MDQRACSPESNSLRGCCTCTEGQGICNGEVVTISTTQAHEIYVRCAPITASGTSAEQAEKFYHCLPRLLSENGAQISDIFWERVFFRNVAEDFDTFRKAREAAYGQLHARCDADLRRPGPYALYGFDGCRCPDR